MKCSICKSTSLKCYCGECIKDRVLQHEWIVSQARLSAAAAKPDTTRHKPNRHLGSSAHIDQLYEYQVGRLIARRQRVATLRARIEARKKLIAEAHQTRDTIVKELERRKARVEDLKGVVIKGLNERAAQETNKLKKKTAVCQEIHDLLRADRGILAETLCDVVGLQLDVFQPEKKSEEEEEEDEE
ncbi:hypothetical protein GGI11_008092 [Coemansia sp. RSA 2049]|nr:hypothetical protein GGI11_008092 [Coemansia sp. RSA 2049]